MRRICIFFLLLVLSGCTYYAPQSENHATRVVTAIDVIVSADGKRHSFCYTENEKMQAVLDHVRQLEPGAVSPITPETFRTDTWEIRLYLSDGSQTIYRQLSDQYLQKDSGPWRNIDETLGARLAALLETLPPDQL